MYLASYTYKVRLARRGAQLVPINNLLSYPRMLSIVDLQ